MESGNFQNHLYLLWCLIWFPYCSRDGWYLWQTSQKITVPGAEEITCCYEETGFKNVSKAAVLKKVMLKVKVGNRESFLSFYTGVVRSPQWEQFCCRPTCAVWILCFSLFPGFMHTRTQFPEKIMYHQHESKLKPGSDAKRPVSLHFAVFLLFSWTLYVANTCSTVNAISGHKIPTFLWEGGGFLRAGGFHRRWERVHSAFLAENICIHKGSKN